MGMCGDVISSPSQLWKLILYAVFPSFLITQMTTIVISLTGTASLEDTTTSLPAHTLSSSPSFLSHSSYPMPFPTPSPAGPTGEAGKKKVIIKKMLYFCAQERAVIFACNNKWEQKAEIEYAREGHCKSHLNCAQGWRVSMQDEEQSLPLLPHN